MGNTHLSTEKVKNASLETAINRGNEIIEIDNPIGMHQTVSPRALLAPNQYK